METENVYDNNNNKNVLIASGVAVSNVFFISKMNRHFVYAAMTVCD